MDKDKDEKDNNEKADSVWDVKGKSPESGVDINLTDRVVKHGQQRVFIKEIIFLILKGFSSIIMGFSNPNSRNKKKGVT